jgi:DNA-binding response OmpR family regulator
LLIVDDSRFLRIHVSTLFESIGVEDIMQAANGYEAVCELDLESPQLITVDNILLDVMGVDLVEKLKSMSPDSKVIMISQIEDDAIKVLAKSKGCDANLTKLVDKETLENCIKEVFAE